MRLNTETGEVKEQAEVEQKNDELEDKKINQMKEEVQVVHWYINAMEKGKDANVIL